eukprot:scaffold8735_cov156-Skeletonema_dohrnii-CCMP3373.AAC.3
MFADLAKKIARPLPAVEGDKKKKFKSGTIALGSITLQSKQKLLSRYIVVIMHPSTTNYTRKTRAAKAAARAVETKRRRTSSTAAGIFSDLFKLQRSVSI